MQCLDSLNMYKLKFNVLFFMGRIKRPISSCYQRSLNIFNYAVFFWYMFDKLISKWLCVL